jgi:hypothetical protein
MDSPDNLSAGHLSIVEPPEFLAEQEPNAAETAPPPADEQGRLRKTLDTAKYALTSAVVTAEILPITNEGARYGALAATEMATRNPLVGAAVLGGSTLLVEGAGAIAAANLLTGSTGNKLFNWVNEKLKKVVPDEAKMSPPLEAGLAMTAGTPILMAAKQREQPDRTKEEARRHGLLTAAWMAGVFAVEGALISEGAGDYTDPKKVGAALLATGAIATLPGWAKKALRKGRAETVEALTDKTVSVVSASEATDMDASIGRSMELYEAFRDQHDEAVKVGLYGEDLERVLRNPRTVLAKYEAGDGEGPAYMPLLVPADELKWYNMPLLRTTYGYGKEYLYYAHPLIPDETGQDTIEAALKTKLDEGDIIFTDQYASRSNQEVFDKLTANNQSYALENIGGGDVQRTGEVFVGPVAFEGVTEVKQAPSIQETYKTMIASGELHEEPENGVSLAETITGEEAERIWEVYKAPFDELSKEHPMYAGFSKEELTDILADPEVVKVVNRVDGTISTLCFFVNDFDHCPWFNKEYYEENYPEYYETGNVLIFPGIVTDQNMRGNDYGMKVIDLATQLYAKRGSNILVTFECTETSAVYIPTIVEMAIGHSGKGKITGADTPISVTEYKALRKSN